MSGPRYQSKRRAVPRITFAFAAGLFAAGVPLIASAATPLGSQVIVYPTAGQTPARLDRDRYECHVWAVKQSGFDPSQPHLAPHQRIQVVAAPPTPTATVAGAVTGAIIGASVSRPSNAGEGAVVGAVAGALLGAASDASRRQQVDRVQQQYDQRDARLQAKLEQQSSDYRRAIAACLEGRGYTVKRATRRTPVISRRQLSIGTIVLLALGLCTSVVHADQHKDQNRGAHEPQSHGYVLDHRYNHDHYYPPRGYAVRELPSGYYGARYRGSPYYFHAGVWYRSYGPRFVVVVPPIGIVLPVLPPFYTTVWFGGTPYYYADNTYYSWHPEERGYVVTHPPGDSATDATTTTVGDDIFVYPKNHQSEEQQANDRYECHSWAVKQTGFDPTQPLGGVEESQVGAKRAEYQRAEGACLEARGYSVK